MLQSTQLSDSDQKRLDTLYTELAAVSPFSVGYPCNQVFDYGDMYRFLEFSMNNVGDPFSGTNYRLNSMEFEREVVMTKNFRKPITDHQ